MPRARIIRLMDQVDVIDLSMSYKAFKLFVMSYKIHGDMLIWTFETRKSRIGRNPQEITESAYENLQINMKFGWNSSSFSIPCPLAEKELEHPKLKNVDGKKVWMERDENNFWMIGLQDTPSKARNLEELTRQLLDICTFETFSLHHDFIRDYKIMDSFVWKFLEDSSRSFDTIRIYNYEAEQLTDQELLTILELKTDALWLNVNMENPRVLENVQIPNVTKKLQIQNCNWMRINDISEIECEEIDITFESVQLTVRIPQLIQLWVTGEKFRNLKRLFIAPFAPGLDDVAENLLNSIREVTELQREPIEPHFSRREWQMTRRTDRQILFCGFGVGYFEIEQRPYS